MDSEEYYDSLDGSRSNSCLSPESECSSPNDEGDVIPYYNLNVNRSEVELDKKTSSKTIVYSQIKNRLKRMQIRNTESKSYLDIFYDRKGIKKMDLMSSEATATTSRSFTTCEDFDVPSLHFNSDRGSTASYISTFNNLALSASSLDSNLQSVSTRKERFSCNKKTANNPTKLRKVPELGRLGHDIPHDKLELYRRRQQYGKKVSQANRIRAIERRTLENLKQEIKLSHNA